MKVINLKHLVFISTDNGCYMVDTASKSGKAITEDCFELISEISELTQEVNSLHQC